MADINALIAGDANAFEGLLQMLMSAQNEQRSQAEAVFAELKKHPEPCASQLIRSLRTSPNLECRSLCAVLLRKVSFFLIDTLLMVNAIQFIGFLHLLSKYCNY
jgi:hypothetical protein